jgi:hypothetical protein
VSSIIAYILLSFLLAVQSTYKTHFVTILCALDSDISTYQDISSSSLMKGINMFNNKDPSWHELDTKLLEIEQELRDRNLLYSPKVQSLMKVAALGTEYNKRWARNKLERILEAERIMDMRTGDVFRPLAPPQLIGKGDLHLYNQVDGHEWRIPHNALTRGMLLTGPQGGGKTRLLIWIVKQLCGLDPPVPFLILDPKQELKYWAEYLGAEYIDISDISIDLSPPPGLEYKAWLLSLMPQVGELVGVIYGVDILQDAANICIEQRRKYIEATGQSTEISLKDILQAIAFVSDTHSGRRSGYREAVATALSRILNSSGNLFACRKGIDLRDLFSRNVTLGCRALTDDFAIKFLGLYLLDWLYESSRLEPPTDTLKSALILDDASRFLAAKAGFDSASKTTSFTHIFASLRSSGRGVIAATQVPHLADAGITALSHTVLCVGGLHHYEDTKLLAHMMGLTDDQRVALSRLARQEAVGICAGSVWPKPVHGFTVDLPDPQEGSYVNPR